MVSPHALRYKPFGSSKEQQKLPEQEPKTASAALQAGVRRNRNNRGIFGDTRCPYDDNDDDDDDDNDDDDDDVIQLPGVYLVLSKRYGAV